MVTIIAIATVSILVGLAGSLVPGIKTDKTDVAQSKLKVNTA